MTPAAAGQKTVLAALLALAFVSLLPNLGLHEFRNEESLRVLVAWEMWLSGDYLRPTFLGDWYYRKPPLFNWLVAASAQLFGWGELAPRAVSVAALVTVCGGLFWFTRRLFNDDALALLAALLFAAAGDVLFFYGFIGEIELTFTAFVFLSLATVTAGVLCRRNFLILASGFFAAAAFLLKGLPAFAFWGLTVAVLVVFHRRWRMLLSPWLPGAGAVMVALPALWILSTAEPLVSAQTLLHAGARRVGESADMEKLLRHMLAFPLKTLFNLLPGSLFALLALATVVMRRKKMAIAEEEILMQRRRMVKVPREMTAIALVALVNFLPYLVAAGSRGRYVIPLFPFAALLCAFAIQRCAGRRLRNIAVATVGVFLIARLALGAAVIPLLAKYKPQSERRIAHEAVAAMAGRDGGAAVACDCAEFKGICLYIGLATRRHIKTPARTPGWDYNLVCDRGKGEGGGTVIARFAHKKEVLLLSSAAPN